MTLERRLRPRKNPVQARAHDTRERIVAAAAHVFASRGYHGGTTNHIAAAAEMSVGSLYQYFPNKDALLVELSRRHVDETAASISALIAEDSIPFAERLAAAVDALVAVHAGDDGDGRLHQVLFEQAPRPDEYLAELRSAEGAVVDQVAELLRDDPTVDVPDVHLAARIVVSTVESLVHRFIARPHDDLDVDAFSDELVRMLVGYLTGGSR